MTEVFLLGPSDRGSGAEIVRTLLEDASVRVLHACPRCGSSRHGPIVISGSTPPRWASVSRSATRTLVAISVTGPVGADLEAADRADRSILDRWTAVEAALKVAGQGLGIDPDTVELDAGAWSEQCDVLVPGARELRVRVTPLEVSGHVARIASEVSAVPVVSAESVDSDLGECGRVHPGLDEAADGRS